MQVGCDKRVPPESIKVPNAVDLRVIEIGPEAIQVIGSYGIRSEPWLLRIRPDYSWFEKDQLGPEAVGQRKRCN